MVYLYSTTVSFAEFLSTLWCYSYRHDLVIQEQKQRYAEVYANPASQIVLYESKSPATIGKQYDGKNPIHVILKSLIGIEKRCSFLLGESFDCFVFVNVLCLYVCFTLRQSLSLYQSQIAYLCGQNEVNSEGLESLLRRSDKPFY